MDDITLAKHLEYLLLEDIGSGDITSEFTPNRNIKAVIESNSTGFVSGVHELKLLFKKRRIIAKPHVKDGVKVHPGNRIFTLTGRVRDILPVERTALNLLSRMSSVTSITREYVDALRKVKSRSKVAATRKTTPGMRYFEKKAVSLGGGLTHRMGLYDMIMLKDNHLKVFGDNVEVALTAAHKSKANAKIEVEVSSIDDALIAAKNGADVIMFDNMKSTHIRKAVKLLKNMGVRDKILLEVSGGITLANIGSYGKTGVDWISTSKITQPPKTLDFTLEIVHVE